MSSRGGGQQSDTVTGDYGLDGTTEDEIITGYKDVVEITGIIYYANLRSSAVVFVPNTVSSYHILSIDYGDGNTSGEQTSGVVKHNYYTAHQQGQDEYHVKIVLVGKDIPSDMFKDVPWSSIELPDITSIGNNVFISSSLTFIDAPDLISIGDQAMRLSYINKELTLPNVVSIGYRSFGGCIVGILNLPKVENVGDEAFALSSDIDHLNMPNVVSIGTKAFSSFLGDEINIGSHIQTIGENAFENIWGRVTINIDRAEGTVSGAPWGLPQYSIATINWTGME